MQPKTNSFVVILGKGYVGTSLSQNLMLKGVPNVCLAKEELDYTNPMKLTRLFAESGVGVVVNAFGYTGKPNVDAAEHEPLLCHKLNVNDPMVVANVCADHGVRNIHLSTGCLFDGYTVRYTEQDYPNNGMFADSSVYCRTKHAFELASQGLPVELVRLRMPYDERFTQRNYLTKLCSYDTLLNRVNSKTCLHDLATFMKALIEAEPPLTQTVYHAVNPDPLTITEIVNMMREVGVGRKGWSIVNSIDTLAPRSNCKLNSLSSLVNDSFRNEYEALKSTLNLMKTYGR